jgi:CRISPR/Cas system-associated exonuclease Cas4 (RecB family)
MDALTRGSLFHRAQAEFFREMEQAGRLPVTREDVPRAMAALEAVLDRVAAEYAERLAPAIERVWSDEIDELRRDLGIWVQKLTDGGAWRPTYFEFSFGLGAGGPREGSESAPAAKDDDRRGATASGGGAPRAFEIDEGRDPRSLREPVVVDGRFVLHGSVDLIEHRADLDVFRVTDHKTGKNRSTPDLVIGGGTVLQPVLYSAAVEEGLKKKVTGGRLFYCTTAGGFVEHEIPINDYTRGQGLQALTIVDRAVEHGFLPAAPAERACTWCDFRPVCGPREEQRVARKAKDKLADLEALRSMR